MLNKALIINLFIYCIVGMSWAACAQSAEPAIKPIPSGPSAPHTIFERLTVQENVKMTLALDMTALMTQKRSRQYLSGTVTAADGKTYEVQVRASGKFRRMKAANPPLKIKFKKKTLLSEGLDTLNNLKIVMPWFDTPTGEELLIREYLAYKMFEQLSPNHVRGRLVRLTLQNTKGGTKKMVALLIEDEEETAARLGGKLITRFGIPADSLEPKQAAMSNLFQYFVGNTDWDYAMIRNVRIIETPEGILLPIPYDFDFSGYVNPPYATPSSESGLKSVRQRYFNDAGLDKAAIRAAIKTFSDAENKLKKVCRSRLISSESQDDLTGFLDIYYRHMKNKDMPPKIMTAE